jgi:hypothetical protein
MALVLLATATAIAGEPCTLVAGSDRAVTVRLTSPPGALVAGVTLVVDHPEEKVGIPGQGIGVPPGTISDKPADAVATANDLGDAVRVVVARPEELPLDAPLLRLHFERCANAKAPAVDEFGCRVSDAVDPSTNVVRDIACEVVP